MDLLWTKHPPTKFDRMLHADPVNPVWCPTCPWDPRYGRFWGSFGLFCWLGTGFVGYGPNQQKTVLAVTRRHRPVFGFFWLIGTALAFHNFLPLTMLGGFTRVFRAIHARFLEGSGEILPPPRARNGPKMPKSGFSRSWGPFRAKSPPTEFDHRLYADPVNPVWGPM